MRAKFSFKIIFLKYVLNIYFIFSTLKFSIKLLFNSYKDSNSFKKLNTKFSYVILEVLNNNDFSITCTYKGSNQLIKFSIILKISYLSCT